MLVSNGSVVPQRPAASVMSPKPAYALISVHGDPASEIGKDGAGGQNVYVRSLGLALAQRGCQVDMFTRRESPDQETVVEHSSGCRTIRLTAGPTQFIPRDQLFEHLPEFVESWLEFQQQFNLNYQLVHTNYWLSGWVGQQLKSRLGLPQVHTYHSIGAVKYSTMGSLPSIAEHRLKVEQCCLENTDCVISTSPQEAADLRRLISHQGRIEVIPCGIDTQHFGQFPRNVARCRLGIDPEIPLILYVGRFDQRKGIETLLHACSQIPENFYLYLVGGSRQGTADWIEQQRLQTLVRDLGLAPRTTFTGRISQVDLPAYYAAANLCVVPSYYEPFGLVAVEAMAAATPVIASRVGGLQHTVIHDETGLLVPPRDADALAAAIQAALSQPARAKTWGEKGQQQVQTQFSSLAVAAKVERLYQLFVNA